MERILDVMETHLIIPSTNSSSSSSIDHQTKEKQENENEDDGEMRRGVVFGSRAHLEEDSISSRSLVRTILMKGF